MLGAQTQWFRWHQVGDPFTWTAVPDDFTIKYGPSRLGVFHFFLKILTYTWSPGWMSVVQDPSGSLPSAFPVDNLLYIYVLL